MCPFLTKGILLSTFKKKNFLIVFTPIKCAYYLDELIFFDNKDPFVRNMYMKI